MLSPWSRPDIAADFPLVLTNAKFTTYVHSQQRRLPSLCKASPEPTADIPPDSVALYGIANEEWIIIESPRGAIKVRVHVTKYLVRRRLLPAWLVAGGRAKELELPGYNPYGADLTDPFSGSLPHRSYMCRNCPAE